VPSQSWSTGYMEVLELLRGRSVRTCATSALGMVASTTMTLSGLVGVVAPSFSGPCWPRGTSARTPK
jgi:hypothetical protein